MFEGCRKVIHKPMSIKDKGKLKVKDTSLRSSPKPVTSVKKMATDGRPIFNIGFEEKSD